MKYKLVILALMFSSCMPIETSMKTSDAWVEIYTAIREKEKECGNKPGYFLYVPDDPEEYPVRLCSMSILRASCPFNDYPSFCLKLYFPEVGPNP
jgi:hypothetical protein